MKREYTDEHACAGVNAGDINDQVVRDVVLVVEEADRHERERSD